MELRDFVSLGVIFLLATLGGQPLHSSPEFWIPIIASRCHGNLRETGPSKEIAKALL